MKSFLNIGFSTMLLSLLLLTPLAAKASTISLVGGDGVDPEIFIPENWNPSNAPDDLVAGETKIRIFDEGGEGVWLNGPANLVYTYIGKEAGSTNGFTAPPYSTLFLTADLSPIGSATATGTMFETSQSSAGFLDFSFIGFGTCCVDEGIFTNGLGNLIDEGVLAVAVAMLDETSLYLMFGDGAGDKDFDDMVVRVDVSAVPVPAAIWLFGTALIGMIGFGKRNKMT